MSEMWRALLPSERKKWEDEAKRKSNFVNTEMKARGYGHLNGISFKGLGSMKDQDLIEELERRAREQEDNVAREKAQAKVNEAAQAAAATATQHSQPTPSTVTSTSSDFPTENSKFRICCNRL